MSEEPPAEPQGDGSAGDSSPWFVDEDADLEWKPPRCPHCESVVVGVTATGPDTIQASCGCWLTQAEARALRERSD
ncbi:hypothetical protein [Natronobiforma cellulositropha]|uniref:hypothetical protein n=1 Tax=Natronobiforma cellulositropha TaxID=1679076 RepID=UPI0021D605D7|nr:hypothetical protein [Natronobiforma cellulositropha]